MSERPWSALMKYSRAIFIFSWSFDPIRPSFLSRFDPDYLHQILAQYVGRVHSAATEEPPSEQQGCSRGVMGLPAQLRLSPFSELAGGILSRNPVSRRNHNI